MKPIRACLLFAALVAALLTLLLLLGRVHWLFELFTHFRLPCAIGFFLLTIALLATKSFKSALGVTVCLILQLIPLSQHYLPFQKDTAIGSGPSLKIISFNILRINKEYTQVARFLERENPDLICLQEIDAAWLEGLSSLHRQFPYSKAHPTDKNTGLLLFSKFPLTQATIHVDSQLGTPYMTAQIDWNGQPLTLINAHPYPPFNGSHAKHLKNTFERIRRDTAQSEHPTIVVGDFNCTAYAHSFTHLGPELLDSARGRGYVASWKRGHPLLAIPIDQVLYSRDLVCHQRRIGPKNGSDHSPIIATLQARSQSR